MRKSLNSAIVGITKRFANKEMIPASKARDANAQHFVANEFLLPITKVFVPRLAITRYLKCLMC